jgi:O-antigen ligase
MGKNRTKKKTTSTSAGMPPVMPQTALSYSKFRSADIISALLIFGYIAVDFIPGGNTADVMGHQWLYLSILNLIGLGYFFFNKKEETFNSIRNISGNTISKLYTALFIVCGFSIIFAMNKTESLVCYARFANSFLMFFCLAILLFKRLHLLKFIAWALSVILLIQSITILIQFFNGLDDTSLNTLIYNLKGNAANKNILAASLVLKIPFAIYCIYISKAAGRLFHSMVLLLGAVTIFIINSRSSYLGLMVEILVFLFFIILINHKKLKQSIYLAGFSILPIIIAFFISQLILNNAAGMQEDKNAYGTVTERLATISFTAEGSNSRLLQWADAVDYIKKKPFTGSGFGNWKLASIPYEKEYVNDLLVFYHVHNDFLEITAETGIVGGLLFISLFLFLAVFLIRILLTANSEQNKSIALFCLMGLGAYFIDSLLNFPFERPILQFFFALLLAIGVNIHLSTKKQTESSAKKNTLQSRILILSVLLILIPALYINFLSYKSLIVQNKVNKDMNYEQPATTWQEIIDAFPKMPNMNMYTFPIDHIKAFYLMQDSKYDEALRLINASADVNPYLTLTEYLKASIFSKTNKLDSAFIYAQKAFNGKPRAKSNYEVLNEVCIKLNDTLTLKNAFHEYIKYRNEPWAWNKYLSIMMYLQQSPQQMKVIADSALLLFPNDPELLQKKNALTNSGEGMLISKEKDDEYRKYFAIGL